MKSIFFLIFLLVSFFASAQFNAEQQLSKKIRQDKYVTFLNEQGYTAEIDKDEDVKFDHNNRSYYLTIDEKDKRFFGCNSQPTWNLMMIQ